MNKICKISDLMISDPPKWKTWSQTPSNVTETDGWSLPKSYSGEQMI